MAGRRYLEVSPIKPEDKFEGSEPYWPTICFFLGLVFIAVVIAVLVIAGAYFNMLPKPLSIGGY